MIMPAFEYLKVRYIESEWVEMTCLWTNDFWGHFCKKKFLYGELNSFEALNREIFVITSKPQHWGWCAQLYDWPLQKSIS